MKMWIIALFVVGLMMLPILTQARLGPDDSLALWFTFDEGDGDVANDASGNENHGKISGKAEWVDSKERDYGTALKFAVNVDVRAPYIKLTEQSHTVEMWIAPNLSSDQQLVFSQKDTNSTNLSMHYRVYNTGILRMGFYGNDLDTPGGMVKKGEWAHIAFWHDADNQVRRIYVNGEMKAEDNGRQLYQGKKGDTVIGSWTDSGQFFDGLIDEVRLWLRPLTETEVQEAMEFFVLSVDSHGKLATTWADLK